MARKKMNFNPSFPLMQPNRRGHRHEVLALLAFGGLVYWWGHHKRQQLPAPVTRHYFPDLYEGFLYRESN